MGQDLVELVVDALELGACVLDLGFQHGYPFGIVLHAGHGGSGNPHDDGGEQSEHPPEGLAVAVGGDYGKSHGDLLKVKFNGLYYLSYGPMMEAQFVLLGH